MRRALGREKAYIIVVTSRIGRRTALARVGKVGLIGGAAILVAALAWLSLRPASPPQPPSATRATKASLSPSAATKAPQLRGRILDPDGNTVAAAAVRVTAQGRSPRVVAETRSDRAGGFSFVTVGSGPVRVEAEHDPGGAVRSAVLTLEEATPADITLVLAPASVRGFVVDAGDGHPIAGATLSVEGSLWAVPGTTTDAAGAFRFPVVPLEASAVVAIAGAYQTARVALGPRDDQPETVLRIALQAGAPVDGDVLDPDGRPLHAQVVACEGQPSEARVESADDGTFRLPASTLGCDVFAMHDEMAPSDAVRLVEGRHVTLRLAAGGSIAGSVVDDRGGTIDSFSVGVESFAWEHGSSARRDATPFHGGTFRLDRLVPGTYVLTASTPGRPPARSDPVEVRSGELTDGVRIVVAPGGVIVGRVFDPRGAPIEDVELRFDMPSAIAGSDAVAKTDGEGRYRLEGAPSGLLTIRAQKDGYRAKLVSGLQVDSGRTLTDDITLGAIDGAPGRMEFGGIGASLGSGSGGIVLSSVFPGEPADRAGIRAGDRIVSIDGEDAAQMSLADAIQRLRGEAGTSVGVSVERGGKPLDVVIPRAEIIH